MRRFVVPGVLIFVLLGAWLMPAAAVPANDLVELSEYFPAETPIYFAVRMDDAFFEEIDALVNRVLGNLPPGMGPAAFSLRETLDEGIASAFGSEATFENTIRTWLGDSAAAGILSLEGALGEDRGDEQPPTLLALEITDRAAALAFLERALEINDTAYELSEVGAFTLVDPETPMNAFWAVGDEALLVATAPELLPVNGDFVSLADSDEVAAALALLPGEDYSAVMTLNLGDTLAEMMTAVTADMAASGEDMALLEAVLPVYENYPAQALGFGIVDARTLVMDLAQTPLDRSVLAGTWLEGVQPFNDFDAVNPAFARFVPADAPLVLAGTELGNVLGYTLNAMLVVLEQGLQTRGAEIEATGEMGDFIENLTASDLREFIDTTFVEQTGLSLRDEVLPAFNGSWTAFARLVPSERLGVMVDAALLIEVTDPEVMARIYDSLRETLVQNEAEFEETEGMLVFPGVIRGILDEQVPRRLLDGPVFDFVVGLDDEVFAVGTRPAAGFGLEPTGPSLADEEAFQYAAQYFLPGAESVGYVGMEPILETIDRFTRGMPETSQRGAQAAMARQVLGVISSAAVTSVTNEDLSAVVRFTLTLAE